MAGTTSQINEKKLKRYLYGEMSDGEIAKIENKIFADDNYFYDIVNFENELIDLYVNKKLEPEEVIRFEKSLAKLPERQTKVANALALQTIIEESRTVEQKKIEEAQPTFWDSVKKFFNPQTFVIGSVMTAALLLVLIVPLVILIIFNLRSNSSLVAGNTANYPMNTNASRNKPLPTPQATLQPTTAPNKKILLLPKVNYETNIENSLKEIELVLILIDSEGKFSVQVNQNQPLNLTSQEMGNRKVLTFFVSTSNLIDGANKILVKNTVTNQTFEYIFTIRKK